MKAYETVTIYHNPITQYGLDEYITNSKYSEWWEELTCSKCDTMWEAKIYREYGRSYFVDEGKMYCPECGTLEGVEVAPK